MLVDREGLWFRVLTTRYGVERGRLRVGGRRGSSWWRANVNIRDGEGGLGGGWFREHVLKKVGDGSDTFFWTDPWVEGIPLCERFGHLFDLAGNKSVSVAEMFALGWGEGGEAWVWRRQLRVWEEEMLGELHCSRCISAVDVSGYSYSRCCGRSHLTQSGSLEGLRTCMATLARQVTYKIKPGCTRHFIIGSSSLCVWMRSGSDTIRSLCSVHFFSRRLAGASLFYAARLASLHVGCVVREKSQIIQRLNKLITSHVGQDFIL
ncbi:hypothetical protein TSUD_92170 [Trifolium subterraneum]|uniref:Reverse transcriptase zinc-binding domain-containing protein n=1 Tax=Trifolium subterraneum TaxID=3900 RepID=A0A2Z6NXF9_TRISU|nr:hypothetical protein TSUD_92170 [Trifolium subterraneum]